MSHYPYRVSSSWGPRRSGFHLGEDIACPAGTPLGAPLEGTVRVRKITYSYGWHVWVIRGRQRALLAHLSDIAVRDGYQALQGELICWSGGDDGNPRSGNSSGAHLHAGWQDDGSYVNPAPKLHVYGRAEALFEPARREDIMTEAQKREIFAAIAASERRIAARIIYESLWGYVIETLGLDGERLTNRNLGGFERMRAEMDRKLGTYGAKAMIERLKSIEQKVS